jgi:hypothetical protein
MADPVSLTFAIASIPGIFISCIDCFQYIRLGQRFGKDFGFCLAKLEAAQVRLTRWGEPIGLLDGRVDIKGPYEDADVIKAYEWLGQIEVAFEEAKETSAKYTDWQKKKGKHGDLEPLDEEKALVSKPSIGNLVSTLRTVTKERQKRLSLPRKITWALYGKDSFNLLIEDLDALIKNLVELFPSNKPRLEELCKQEISGLDKESILDLIKVLKNEDENSNTTDDEILSKAIIDHIETHRLEFDDVKVDGAGITRLGDDYGYQSGVKPGSINAKTLEIKGSGYTQVGHIFYGSQGAQGMHSYGKDTQPSQFHTE